ncbi:MAG: hypothetical protein QW815_07735 [Nitrososphaerota archaeon]
MEFVARVIGNKAGKYVSLRVTIPKNLVALYALEPGDVVKLDLKGKVKVARKSARFSKVTKVVLV